MNIHIYLNIDLCLKYYACMPAAGKIQRKIGRQKMSKRASEWKGMRERERAVLNTLTVKSLS